MKNAYAMKLQAAKQYLKNEERKRIINRTITTVFQASAVALHENFGFGADRIKKFRDSMEQAIKERDEARKAAEMAQSEARAAEVSRDQMEKDMAVANASLEGARAEKEAADGEVARLAKELDELKSRPVDVAVETVVDQEAVARARKEGMDWMQAKVEHYKKASEDMRLASGMEKDLAQFDLLMDQAQEAVNKMHGILLKVRVRDGASARKLSNAIRSFSESVGRYAE